MSDIFREVDEEVRRDRAIEFWKKHQTRLIALAVLIVLATAAWQAWLYWQKREAEQASASYDAALGLASAGKNADAKAAFDKLAASTTTGYRDLARLLAADSTARGDAAAGVKAFDALAGDSTLGPLFQELARLRAALLLLDTADAKTLQNRLEPLAAATAPFRHTAREMLVLAALKRSDVTAANHWLSTILADPASPAELRERASGYLGIVQGMKPAPGS